MTEHTLRIAGTVSESIVDGPGLRYTVFVQGCPHGCPGCHNPQTHDFAGGTILTVQRLLDDIARFPHLKGITLSGGEPFCQAEGLAVLARELRKQGKHLMCYSGYTFEELLEMKQLAVRELLEQLDLLVDGPFILEERSLELRFRGSRNQRILDVPASLAAGKAVWEEKYR